MAINAEQSEQAQKPPSMLSFLIALVVVSALAVGAGWFLSANLTKPTALQEPDTKLVHAQTEPSEKKEVPDKAKSEGKLVVSLDPIIVGLSESNNTWLRLELTIIADEDAHLEKPEIKSRVANDIAAFVKTLTLRQISGPSGYLHLKEDLLDRARLTTHGKVREVMIMTLVVE